MLSLKHETDTINRCCDKEYWKSH